MNFTKKYLEEVIQITKKIDDTLIEKVINHLKSVKKAGGRIFFLGVGGSAGNASHAVNDFRKIVEIESYAPTDNVSELTARTNDEGFSEIFSEWLKISKLNSKDLLFIFSVGGGNEEKNISVNLIKAIKYSKEVNAKSISILGKDNGYAAKNTDVAIIIPTIDPDRITPHSEGYQAVIWHLIVSHPELKTKNTKWESVEKK